MTLEMFAWKVHNFALRLQTKGGKFFNVYAQTLSALILQFNMGLVYAQTLKKGEEQCRMKQKRAKSAKQRSGKPKSSVPPVA